LKPKLRLLKTEDFNGKVRDDYSLSRIISVLGISQSSPEMFAETLPFSLHDTTAGAENEFQTVVIGKKEAADLPVSIETSNYYKNILKRSAAGETPRKVIAALEDYLNDNPENVWENSWVRFPRSALSPYANEVFNHDLLSDKKNSDSSKRKDAGRFVFFENGEEYLRIPVSYLLKLSLADAVSSGPRVHPIVKRTGERFMRHFLNDNTSPETFSFYPVPLDPSHPSLPKMGKGIAGETLKRFLLTQFLTLYANEKFRLTSLGQRAMVYFAPHPPIRQKNLNDLITDSFYRDLFMSPCLSGWDRGEVKQEYMHLCHKVLSNSQLNAVAKLKEAGIITRNLVVLPTLSNISLANNGTHISLGSRKLTRVLGDPASGFGAQDEKYLGDLAIKIIEHFLPLFVGTYSAAPYRLDFWDFHPEKALGFLPHELDFTHLRMMWRRWKKKAKLKILGHPVTPFGPQIIDKWISIIFQLKGDFIHDFRIIDYLVSLMSTNESPAMDGAPGNDRRLKKDLADFGVFDPAMPLYLLYRLREFSSMGFSGFEGRYYSLFENLWDDMGQAASLQSLITALAFKYILKGEITHAQIPDNPSAESERRQIFFGSAIGLPTFFIRQNSANRLMAKIFGKVKRTRLSRRYPGYIRAYHLEYRRALIEVIREDAADLIEMMGLEDTISDLISRIESPRTCSAAGKLTRGILDAANVSSPMKISGQEFNIAAERYYREELRKQHMRDAMTLLEQNFRHIDRCAAFEGFYGYGQETIREIFGNNGASGFLELVKGDVIEEKASADVLKKLIHFTLLVIHSDMMQSVRKDEKDDIPQAACL
jgi:hypothetical protein